MKIGTASLLSPSAADAYYSSGTTSTNGLGNTTRPVEIIELARALAVHTNPADPTSSIDVGKTVDRIYQYVRNNVELSWSYGLQKGAMGALVDKSGTAFDQTMLMVELLRQNGITADYKAGTITLSGTQFTAWTGISDATAACQLLSSGGIPAVINGSTTANCGYSHAAISTVTLGHIWVSVTIGGTAYVFDPAYKPHDFMAGIDLKAAAGLTTSGQSVPSVGSSGTSSGVAYIQNVDAETLASTLDGYATGILSATNSISGKPAPEMEDLVGGQKIQRYEIPSGGLRQASLPYTASVQHTWTGGIPDQYRTTLKVKITKLDYTKAAAADPDPYVQMWDKSLYVDEIYGRKLTVNNNFGGEYYNFGVKNGSGYQGTLDLVDERGGTQQLASYSSIDGPDFSVGTITLTVNHPYANAANGSTTASGDYMDTASQKKIDLTLPFTIVHSWGDTNGLIAKWGSRPDRLGPWSPDTKQTQIPTGSASSGCDMCRTVYKSGAGDGRREGLAAQWMEQSSKAARLHALIGKGVFTLHHSVGVVYADAQPKAMFANPSGTIATIYEGGANPADLDGKRVYNVVDSFDVIDVDSAFSVTSKTADAGDRRAMIFSIATTSDALEGSVAAQTADLPDTTSTATRFEWANRPPTDTRQDPSQPGPRRFYAYQPGVSNSTIVSLTKIEGSSTAPTCSSGCLHGPNDILLDTNEFNGRRNNLATVVKAYTDDGFTVVASEEGFTGPGQRAGDLFVVASVRGGSSSYQHHWSKQRGGAFVAVKYDGNGDPIEIAHVVVGPEGDYGPYSKGGGGGAQTDHQATWDPAQAADVLKAKFKDKSTALGVSLKTGQVTYVSPAQLKVGPGEFPYSLSAQLIWRGGTEPDPRFGPLDHTAPQGPWTTNWNNNLTISSSALEAMGSSDPRAAAQTVAAFLAMQDIYHQSASTQRDVAGVLVNSWWVRQLQGNVVTVSLGSDTKQFVRIANGTFIKPGSGEYATLTQTGSRYVVEKLTGDCANSMYSLTRGWEHGDVGFTVTGAHGDVQTWTFWREHLNTDACRSLHGFHLTSWTFPQGVTVSLTYGTQATDNVDQLLYVSNNLGWRINFTDGGVGGFDNNLTGGDLRAVAVSTMSSDGHGRFLQTHTDPSGAVTSFILTPFDFYGPKTYILSEVYDAANVPQLTNPLSFPNLRYDYDGLRRVMTARDGVALQSPSLRGAYQFLIADGVRAERIDGLGNSYSVEFDTDHRPIRYVDELGRTTSVAYDGWGRVTGYTYPEGDQETFEYDVRNNTTKFKKIAKPGSAEFSTPIEITATWSSTWNKPLSLVDARGNTTTFTYVASGNGASLMATATRPQDVDGSAPVYSFSYNNRGLPTDLTDPTGIVTHNVYGTNGTLTSTTADYGTGRLNLSSSFTYDAQGDVVSATDARSYVTNFTYDPMRRKVFTIQPDPDGAGSLLRPTQQTVYDAAGRPTVQARGTATNSTASDFSALSTVTVTYDLSGMKTKVVTPAGVTQLGYDVVGRPLCTAVRVNPNTWSSLPTDACALSTTGAYGQDRISKTIYDAAGQPLQALQGFGTSNQRTYSTYTYSMNGLPATVADANANKTTYEYDGFDRLVKLRFPVTTLAAGSSSTTDYEQYGYDPNGNRTSLRKRDGNTISFTYDKLNREIVKDIPGGTSADVYTDYDLAGRPTHARFVSRSGSGVDFAYDGAGRPSSETTLGQAMSYQYDAAGNRTRVTWPDSYYADYVYDPLNRPTAVRENGATSGVGVLASFSYDDLGRRTSLTRGNGTSTTYSFDSADRLIGMSQDMSGTTYDQSWTFAFSPASQLTGKSSTNTAYEWSSSATTVNQTYDGLNRDAAIAAISGGYDANGNVTNDGTRTFTYDVENRLVTVGGSPGLSLGYDPLGRLRQTVSGSTTTKFLYSGSQLVGEYDDSGTLLNRYVHGPNVDEPLVWYVGTGTSARHFLHADRQGSIIAESDSSGAVIQVYTYGPWGENGANNGMWTGSRFRYTGQLQLPEAGLYYYKAREYDPGSGRFMQTDPIGYQFDFDLYAYVGGDPVNKTDPSGKLPAEGSAQEKEFFKGAHQAACGASECGREPTQPGGVGIVAGGTIQGGQGGPVPGPLGGRVQGGAQAGGAVVVLNNGRGRGSIATVGSGGAMGRVNDKAVSPVKPVSPDVHKKALPGVIGDNVSKVPERSAIGVDAGVGVGVVVTNAGDVEDMKGPGDTVTVTTPVASASVTSGENGVWVVTFELGVHGGGISVTRYPTYTVGAELVSTD